MTLSEWIALYERKAEPYVESERFQLHFDEGHGFVQWTKLDGDVLFMGACCSNDIRWAYGWVKAKAKELGCRTLATMTCRNPRAFLRRAYAIGSNAHIDLPRSGWLDNGRWYWFLTEAVRE